MSDSHASFFRRHLKLIVGGLATVTVLGAIGALTEKLERVPRWETASTTTHKSPVSASSSSPPLSVTPPSVGSRDQRLAVASEIRDFLRDQDIPANVVAVDTTLKIYYHYALIEYAPEMFVKQQGESGMRRIANAGFEMLIISAQDPNRTGSQKEIALIGYRSR